MNRSDLKKRYGDEYPAAVILEGIRLPLTRESRFSRSYHSDEHKLGTQISRFMDGSASITSSMLQLEWPGWTEGERMDFCQSCDWLHEQADYSTMLRFIMEHGGPKEWSGVALNVASRLPREEAYDILNRALSCSEPGRIAHGGSKPPLPASRFVDPVAWLVVTMFAAAFVAGAGGFWFVHSKFLSLPTGFAELIPPARHPRFMAAWFAHGASHLFGIVGGTLLIFRVHRARGRPTVISLFPRSPGEIIRAMVAAIVAAHVLWARFGAA